MKILDSVIMFDEFKQIAENIFGNMVKAVVDIERELIAIDAELPSDLESLLLDAGSKQKDLWGINLYLNAQEDYIEFDSMINLRPSQGNMSRGVDSSDIQKKIIILVNKWIKI